MSQSSPPPPENEAHGKEEKVAGAATVAWYARPWPWSILLFLLLALYVSWLLWLQWQAHAAMKLTQEELLLQQQARNAQLEADAARLREALTADPCVARGILQDWRVPAPLGEGASVTPAAPLVSDPKAEKQPEGPATKAEASPPPPKDGKTPPPAEPKNMAELLEQATVLILTQSPKGLMMGTGFFIAPGIVLTNQHVIGGGTYPMFVVGKFPGSVVEGKALAVSKVKGRDYAVLKVPVTSVKPLSIALNVARTQKISAWGFPGAVTGDDPKFQALLRGQSVVPPEVVYSEGSVSVVLDRTPPLIVHTAVVSQGNSGGPLVNEKGHVVGINTYIRLDDESYRQSSIAIVGKDLVAFLKENKIPFTLAGDKE